MIELQEFGQINDDLMVLNYRKWTVSRIAPCLYFYRKATATRTMLGMTPEDDKYSSDREALLAALKDIDCIERKELAKAK